MAQLNASNDVLTDSLSFVKKLWGQMGVPGFPNMPLPGMSPEDLEKRIQELKTVETWLNINLTMLRNTIQALEVQRATIAALHSLSSTMTKTMQGMGSDATSSATDDATEQETQEAMDVGSEGDAGEEEQAEVSPLVAQSAAWWQGVQDQFKQALSTALEKSAANYEVARSASEDLVRATGGAPTMKAAKMAAGHGGDKSGVASGSVPKSKVRASARPPARKTSGRSTGKSKPVSRGE